MSANRKEFKDIYETHDLIVEAQTALSNTNWTHIKTVHYDTENPLKKDWGLIYTKNDNVVYLNRFTVETIISLLK